MSHRNRRRAAPTTSLIRLATSGPKRKWRRLRRHVAGKRQFRTKRRRGCPDRRRSKYRSVNKRWCNGAGPFEQNDSATMTFCSRTAADTGVAGQGSFSASPWMTNSGNEQIVQLTACPTARSFAGRFLFGLVDLRCFARVSWRLFGVSRACRTAACRVSGRSDLPRLPSAVRHMVFGMAYRFRE
jgi:hypothetical protein